MIRHVYIIILNLVFFIIRSQTSVNSVARFTFNNGNLHDERRQFEIKAYIISFVEDRFGNQNSACFIQGGRGSYLNIGTSDKLKPKQGSISLWVNIAHPMLHGIGVETNPILYTRSHSGFDHNEAYFIGYDYIINNLNVNTTLSKEKQITLYGTKPFSLRKWHHVVITYNNDHLSFYLNGNMENKMVKNFKSTFLKDDSILVGSFSSAKNQRYFNGTIDDIEIFNKVLSGEEVLNLYHAPNPNRWAILFWWLEIGVLIMGGILIASWLVRRRIRKLIKLEKQKNELINHALEQEIKMLKVQMDPHFIFNSLNTIMQLIITKKNDKAELYLSKFSKLIRKLLESTTNDSISLQNEIDILNDYLVIESLRFNNIIHTEIKVSEGLDPMNTFIPHMLVQPFVENAIWHGLRLKEGEKIIKIRFEKKSELVLICTVDDNGLGRIRHFEEKRLNKDRPLAINFIKQRLCLMSKIYNEVFFVEITDKIDNEGMPNGTKVKLGIPIIKK